jgi:hypothetical protein
VAATQASIVIRKQFTYRGVTHVWSNRYYLNQTSIDTQAHFNTLADAITTAEKAIYGSNQTITLALYYAPGSGVAVWTKTYSLAGTGTFGAGPYCPGDCAALIRYTTSQRTSKNHPLYLFNYYHGVVSVAGGGDTILAAQAAAYATYAGSWVTGFSDGVTTYKKAGPRGAVATGSVVETYITHRDFPR